MQVSLKQYELALLHRLTSPPPPNTITTSHFICLLFFFVLGSSPWFKERVLQKLQQSWQSDSVGKGET